MLLADERYFLIAVISLDGLLAVMYLYHFVMHGIRTRDWRHMFTWMIAEVTVTQLIPVIMGIVLLVDDAASCNTNFCSKGFYLLDDPNTILTIMAVWDFLGSLVLRMIFVIFSRVIPCCRKSLAIFPMHIGNLVERFELLIILCLGEQVVALTSLTFTTTTFYAELWENSTLCVAKFVMVSTKLEIAPVVSFAHSAFPVDCYRHEQCNAASPEVLVIENTSCMEAACLSLPEDQRLETAPTDELFAEPEYQMMIAMLFWLALFRLSVFE